MVNILKHKLVDLSDFNNKAWSELNKNGLDGKDEAQFEAEIEQELDGVDQVETKIQTCICEVERSISQLKRLIDNETTLSNSLCTSSISNDGPMHCSAKLPKLSISAFNGDKLPWYQFWDSFCSSVHNNHQLSLADKFGSFLSLLGGEAKCCVLGLSVTND